MSRTEKIDDTLGVMSSEEILDLEETEISTVQETDLSTYTGNPELQEEITKYKKERRNSINKLTKSRDATAKVIKDMTRTVVDYADDKAVESFTKAVRTLTQVVKSIDELTDPQKLQMYIDGEAGRLEGGGDGGGGTNIQVNVYNATPADLLKELEDAEKKNVIEINSVDDEEIQ